LFPPDHQRVNQVLEIGIELGDVASDGQDVGIQCTDLGSDLHDHCPGVDVGFVDECLEVSHANWAVPNVVVLGGRSWPLPLFLDMARQVYSMRLF